jgi:pyrimidine operon attenuation protein/uracil phosphoribosyltransferase
MESQILMSEELFERVLDRLAHQLLEHHDFSRTDIVGLQPRGYDLAKLLKAKLESHLPNCTINCGGLDTTFHRDDFRRREKPITPQTTTMPVLGGGPRCHPG